MTKKEQLIEISSKILSSLVGSSPEPYTVKSSKERGQYISIGDEGKRLVAVSIEYAKELMAQLETKGND